MQDGIRCLSELEIVEEMLVLNQNELKRMELMERYLQRRALADVKLQPTLGATQKSIGEKESLIKFLEEVKKEYETSSDRDG